MEEKLYKYPYHSRVDLQMRFRDVDIFGHVNNNVYFEYMDLGKLDYILSVLGDIFNTQRDSLVVANVNCDFLAPTRYGEKIAVETRTDAIGVHSINLRQRVINVDTGEVKCRAGVVMVGFDARTSTSIEIPDQWRKLISDHENRRF